MPNYLISPDCVSLAKLMIVSRAGASAGWLGRGEGEAGRERGGRQQRGEGWETGRETAPELPTPH